MNDTGKADLNRWIEASYREYGNDPWCFLRELAQNSRDADARRIEVTCGRSEDGKEWLTFLDNGRGMSWSTAESFLLKLYASSKDENQDYAGTFGVGFWTVLLFEPEQIEIFSRTEEENWGLCIDHRLNIVRQTCSIENNGTAITLTRPAKFDNLSSFRDLLMERIRHYCRFMSCRKIDLPLDIQCEGHAVSSPLTLGLQDEFIFKSRHLKGVLAISTEPRVELLVKGIPVWSGCSLNELRQIYHKSPAETVSLSDFERAPSFLLDAQTLKVSFTRREVIHDKHLDILVTEAQKALSLYLRKQAGLAFPQGWKKTVSSWLSTNFMRIVLLLLFMIISIPSILYALNKLNETSETPISVSSIQAAQASSYKGSLQPYQAGLTRLPYEISYFPTDPILLTWFCASRFDERSGWIQAEETPHPLPEVLVPPEISPRFTFTMRGFTNNRVPFLLPTRENLYRIVSIAPTHPMPTVIQKKSELQLQLPDGTKTLIYQTYAAPPQPLTESDRTYWLEGPDLSKWPASWQKMILQGRSAIVADRIHMVQRLMKANFYYSRTPRRFLPDKTDDQSWLTRVLNMGMGDCDVVNGFAVLLLRSLNIPARLIIGWQGQDGHLTENLHAWCEVNINQHWTVFDYSILVPVWRDQLPVQPAASNWKSFILPFSLLLSGLVALMLLVLLLKSRFVRFPRAQPASHSPLQNLESIRSDLIRTARSAVLRPRLWGSDNAIWDMHLLPSISGSISLREAVSAFNKGRLISLGAFDLPPGSMIKPLTRNRFIRMNGSETDEICRLLPKNLELSNLPWHTINLPQEPVLEELNLLLRREWKIVETDSPDSTQPLLWYDLRAVEGAKKAYGSRQLIILSKGSHPAFPSALSAWEWICEHHTGLSFQTIRRVAEKLIQNIK